MVNAVISSQRNSKPAGGWLPFRLPLLDVISKKWSFTAAILSPGSGAPGAWQIPIAVALFCGGNGWHWRVPEQVRISPAGLGRERGGSPAGR